MIVAAVNVKGGVGKTTTAVNLAAAFAGAGLATLLVDLDPQASASHSLGVAPGAEPTVADVVVRDRPLGSAVQPTGVLGLSLLAGSLELAGADLVLARRKDPVDRLAKALGGSRDYDVTVIDCPPGFSLLTLMGLQAAQGMIVPINPQDLAVDALGRFFSGLEQLGELITDPPVLLGILITMVDRRTKVTDELIERVRGEYGRKVFTTEIPLNIRLAVAPSQGSTIFDYQGWAAGGVAYRKLGGEVLRRARRRELL